MCAFLFILLYVLPAILLIDLITITYRSATEKGSDVYLYEIILYAALSLSPIFNLALSIIYMKILFDDTEDIHDSLVEDFEKYSTFKFLLNKIN